MVFGKSKLELKVGIFVFTGLVILVTFVLMIGKFKTWTSGYRIGCVFTFVNGVKLGAPVRYAGVDVGEVKEIKFSVDPEAGKTKVKIVCWIDEKTKVPVDSTVWVNTLGLLGEKYVEIMPGKNYNQFLVKDEELIGEDPVPMQEVTRLAKSIAYNLEAGILNVRQGKGTIGKLLYDDSLYNDLEAFANDLKKHPWKLFWKTKENAK